MISNLPSISIFSNVSNSWSKHFKFNYRNLKEPRERNIEFLRLSLLPDEPIVKTWTTLKKSIRLGKGMLISIRSQYQEPSLFTNKIMINCKLTAWKLKTMDEQIQEPTSKAWTKKKDYL